MMKKLSFLLFSLALSFCALAQNSYPQKAPAFIAEDSVKAPIIITPSGDSEGWNSAKKIMDSLLLNGFLDTAYVLNIVKTSVDTSGTQDLQSVLNNDLKALVTEKPVIIRQGDDVFFFASLNGNGTIQLGNLNDSVNSTSGTEAGQVDFSAYFDSLAAQEIASIGGTYVGDGTTREGGFWISVYKTTDTVTQAFAIFETGQVYVGAGARSFLENKGSRPSTDKALISSGGLYVQNGIISTESSSSITAAGSKAVPNALWVQEEIDARKAPSYLELTASSTDMSSTYWGKHLKGRTALAKTLVLIEDLAGDVDSEVTVQRRGGGSITIDVPANVFLNGIEANTVTITGAATIIKDAENQYVIYGGYE